MKRMSSSLRAKEEFMMMCREGIYQAGERLPSETKMAQQFGVSRETWRAALELLDAEERRIVLLHAVTGWKHREIASLLELPLPTVLSKYHRALKKLRKQLEGENVQ